MQEQTTKKLFLLPTCAEIVVAHMQDRVIHWPERQVASHRSRFTACQMSFNVCGHATLYTRERLYVPTIGAFNASLAAKSQGVRS